MIFREAEVADIKQIQVIRHAVKENILSDPSLVTDEDCKEYITNRGKGWVCEDDDRMVGFAIADLLDHSIWALFLLPEYEKKGNRKKVARDHAFMVFRKYQHWCLVDNIPGYKSRKILQDSWMGRNRP